VTEPGQRPPGQLIPAALRPAAGIIIALCAVIFAILAALVFHGNQPIGPDSAMARLVQPQIGPGGFSGGFAVGGLSFDLAAIGQVGGPIPAILLTCILVYCCLAMRRLRGAILVAASIIIASSLTEFVLKPLIHRTYVGDLSFPSGHTTGAFALVAAIVVLLIDPPGTRMPASLRVVLAVLSLGAGGLVAVGLVAGRQHFFTDTIGGGALSITVTLSTALVIDRVAGRRARSEVPAPRAAEPAQVST
jgi:membrane-associated phospholipid phosphatase